MQKPRLPFVAYLYLSITASLFSSTSFGAITLESVTNASRYDTSTSVPKFTIYGGVAGNLPATYDVNSVVDNCANPTSSGRYACNSRRIHPGLKLTITFKAGTKGGRPAISTTATTPENLTLVDTPSSVGANQTVSVSVLWSTICDKLGNVSNTCVPSDLSKAADANFKVGLITSATGTDIDSNESETIKVVVSGGIGQANGTIHDLSQSEGCDAAVPPTGLCHFQAIPGDKKVTISKPATAVYGFPNASPLNFRAIRVFYAEVANSTSVNAGDLALYQTAYDSLNSTSEYQELLITGTDPADPSFAPSRIEGLENDKVYVFALAHVDLAGNVGYYSASGAPTFTYCAKSWDPSTLLCKVAQPGEVVGVLTEQMNCFIATASYGSIFAPQVETFRQFRDQILSSSSIGQQFIRLYYQNSPALAKVIAQDDTLRALGRVFLMPFLAFAWLSLQLGAGLAALIMISSTAIMIYALIKIANFKRTVKAD